MKKRVNRLSKRPPVSSWCFMTVPLWYGQWDWECHPVMFQTCYFFIAGKQCFSSEATLSQLWCSPLQAILAEIQQPTGLTLAYPRRSILRSCRMRPDVYGWVWYSRSFCLTKENNMKSVWWLRKLPTADRRLRALCVRLDQRRPEERGKGSSAWFETSTQTRT